MVTVSTSQWFRTVKLGGKYIREDSGMIVEGNGVNLLSVNIPKDRGQNRGRLDNS